MPRLLLCVLQGDLVSNTTYLWQHLQKLSVNPMYAQTCLDVLTIFFTSRNAIFGFRKHKIYPQPPSPCCDTRRCPFRYGLAGNPKLYIYILPPVGSSPTNTTTLDFLPAIYYALVSLISYGSLLKLTSKLLLGTHVSTVSILRSAPQAVGAFRRIVMCKLCASILL